MKKKTLTLSIIVEDGCTNDDIETAGFLKILYLDDKGEISMTTPTGVHVANSDNLDLEEGQV